MAIGGWSGVKGGDMFPASRWFVLFSMLVSVSWTSRAAAGEVECDPAALEQAMAGCGIDVACINQVMADYNAACMAQAGTEGGGTGGTGGAGMGGMADAMARIQACGGDPACQQEVMEELQQQYEEGASMTDEEFETTSRLHERTVLPSSWLQSYQEALVSCEKNVGCWTGLMAGALAFTDSVCGPLSPSEAVALCHVAARYEIHIEQAIAQQRLWRKGIRFEGDAPGAEPLGEPSPGGSPTPGSGTKVPDASKKSFTFLPKVKESNVRKLLDTWERKLEKELAAEARQKIDAGAAQFPVDSEAGTPPLVYEEKETPEGLEMDAHPTRRDWYYALTGVLLTHAGLVEGGEKGEVLLDAALWSLIQAAQMKPEVEHFSNIGFHLNLRGELDAARTVLTHARTLDGNHPDVYNNLAFGYSAEGKAEEALALQENAARLAPDNAHIRSRLESMAGAAGKEPMPYGGDFGEAFFRFGKRHTLREVEAGRRWFKARELAKHRNFGGTPVVPGPHEWYAEQIRDIEDAHSACIGNAPEVAAPSAPGSSIRVARTPRAPKRSPGPSTTATSTCASAMPMRSWRRPMPSAPTSTGPSPSGGSTRSSGGPASASTSPPGNRRSGNSTTATRGRTSSSRWSRPTPSGPGSSRRTRRRPGAPTSRTSPRSGTT